MDKINRRKFIKSAGLAGGALSLAGVAGAGYSAGADKDSYTGYGRTAYGEDQFFNRKPFFVDKPTYVQEEEPVRITAVEDIFKRNGELSRLMFSRNGDQPAWKPSDGMDALPGHLRAYYQANPGAFDEFIKAMQKGREQRASWEKYRDKYFIADAWSNAHSSPIGGRSAFPAEPQGRPEESDFRGINKIRLELKSPRHGSDLIKQICYSFGASLAGIAKVKKEWVYQGSLRGVGRVDYDVPSHWKYAVVIAVPHEWDSMYANPTYGTSYDAYSKLRFIAGKMEVFIIGLAMWLKDMKVKMNWWKWSLTLLWFTLLSITVAGGFTLIGENELRAGLLFMAVPGAVIIVAGVALGRFLLRNTDEKKNN